MCVAVYSGEKRIASQGGLRDLVGSDLVWFGDPPPDQDDEWCLCGIDIEATAERYGLAAVRDDMGDYDLSPGQPHG